MAKIGRGTEVPLSWIPARNGHIPDSAVCVDLFYYVARCKHGSHWIPGKAVTGDRVCYYSHDGKQLSCKEFELLCETSVSDAKKCYEWVPGSCGDVPENAIIAGMKGDKALYIVKGTVNFEPSIGKLQQGDKYACLTWRDEEYKVKQYDVLVFKQT
uniref:DUF3421 domain-containing protein n=1 Tax=Trichobilharzia regenti TaxID=157069 RepID=A0AA85JKC2_TRIRE|nr:unnamed protein product [Trichobilharzia regenti]